MDASSNKGYSACRPWVDLSLSGETVLANADVDVALTADGLRRRAADYAAGRDVADPLISPLFGDLGGLPPLLIQSGGDEILLNDATRLATRAAEQGTAVMLDVTPGVPHVFQGFAAMLDEAAQALDRAGAFLRDRLAARAPSSPN